MTLSPTPASKEAQAESSASTLLRTRPEERSGTEAPEVPVVIAEPSRAEQLANKARKWGVFEPLRQFLWSIVCWFDTHAQARRLGDQDEVQRVDWIRVVPFVSAHLACLAVFWVGWSPVAVAVAVGMYAIRMFAITGFYHRYFSHRSFKTSRAGQFAFALLGASATQRGPLWWASHHRLHHKNSDKPEDVHSPKQHGFLWSHMGWISCKANFATRFEAVRDLVRFPELRFLDRFDTLVPILTGAAMFFLGMALDALWPSLGTSAGQMLVWGYFVSTIVLAHATFTINSLSHVFGSRRFETSDTSRNNPFLAVLTLGEGWHNNHHHYQSSARQGFYWWEYDITYYGLKVLSWLGIIWDLRPVPASVLEAGRQANRDR